jgi:hypothetical protein
MEGFIKLFSSQYPGVIEGLDLSGAKRDYKKTLELIAETAINNRTKSYVLPMDIAQIFLLLGDKDKVIEWCEKGIEERDPNAPYIAQIFVSMRDDPRFQQIIRKMNLPI